MMITETVLKTLGICGLVGAGTVAINEVSRVQKKKKAVLPVVEEELVDTYLLAKENSRFS